MLANEGSKIYFDSQAWHKHLLFMNNSVASRPYEIDNHVNGLMGPFENIHSLGIPRKFAINYFFYFNIMTPRQVASYLQKTTFRPASLVYMSDL